MKVISDRWFLRRNGSRWLLSGLLVVSLASITAARQVATRPATAPATSGTQAGPARPRGASDRGGSLTGRVVEEGGQPIADASVLATPVGVMNGSSALGVLKVRSVLTDESGRFV